MKRVITIFILILVVFAAIPVGAAHADSLTDRIIRSGDIVDDDVEVVGGNLTIEDGAVVNGDVVVFGGHAEIAGEINGDVAIFGGTVELNGIVDGELVIFGGNLEVLTQAEITGECALLGGSVNGDEAANINCASIGEELSFAIPNSMFEPVPPIAIEPLEHNIPSRRSPVYSFFSTVGEVAGRSLMLGLLALIMASLIPTQLNQVRNVIGKKPVASGTVGVLTAMAGPFAIAILALVSTFLIILCGLGLLGYPILLVVTVALAFGLVMGWIAAGTLLGERLAGAMNLKNRSLPIVAALGTVVLTLLASTMSELPFWLGGWVWAFAAFIIACAGLGAVALTKFGTRAYPVGARTNGEKVSAVLETLPVEDADQA